MADTYRPGGYRDNSRRSRSPHDMYRFGEHNRDSYYDSRQDDRRGEFTFRKEGNTEWPTEPRADRSRRTRNGERNQNRNRNRGGLGFKPRGSKAANERKILHAGVDRDITPERLAGMVDGSQRFNAEGASEEESESSSDSDSSHPDKDGSSNEEGPSKKRSKQDTAKADGNDKPTWSNPDPYYALPPTLDENKKKKDVVQLIRKAKTVAETKAQEAANAVTANDDFISFGMDDDENSSRHSSEESSERLLAGAVSELPTPQDASNPSTTKPFSHLTNLHPLLANPSSAVPNGPRASIRGGEGSSTTSPAMPARDDRWPPAEPRPQGKKLNKKRKQGGIDGDISEEWIEDRHDYAVPWAKEDHSNSLSTGVWLHKEICDFYEFVKPTAHEHAMRKNLVDRISAALTRRWPRSSVHSFGSYAYGIYLPTADMDLCFVSDTFRDTGRPLFDTRHRHLWKYLQCLDQAGIASRDGQQVIPSAKVPIIKFVDEKTGLKVDISFENLGGVDALSTFNTWKTAYPVLPVLVSVIKQFLLMRDLNEVFNGGLGGFSVACMVVSMLQLSPDIQSDNVRYELDYGALLLRFFDLYGNKFNMTDQMISLDPPGYFAKDSHKSKGKTKWQIRDPNNSTNDVSGGSTKAELIADKFSEAYHELTNLMKRLDQGGSAFRRGQSILRPIFGGNYRSFVEQREQLHYVYDRIYGENAPRSYYDD